MTRHIIISLFCCMIFLGCEDTNLELATQAGLDAIKAVTLSDHEVQLLAAKASDQSDAKNQIAGKNNPYGKRLKSLVGENYDSSGYRFDFKVYLSPTVNAFAMADGTIRIYSGLMDMLDDDELIFVVGHEIGHVVKKHIKKKIMVAYAASSIRKGIASQENIAGDIARSSLGGLVQALLNAQFSQAEEREADDFGVMYLKEKNIESGAAVSALRKLDRLGKNHSFLSSHPDPAARAKRIETAVLTDETADKRSFIKKLAAFLTGLIKYQIQK